MRQPKIYNLTFSSQLLKHFPNSQLPALIKKAEDTQKAFNEKLALDKTKTPTEQARLLNQSGSNQVEQLIDLVQRTSEPVSARLKGYYARIDAMHQIRNTTDAVVLNSEAAALLAGKFTNAQLFTMAQSDPDAARAVLLAPSLKYSVKLTDGMKREFNELLAKHTLDDEYENYKSSQLQQQLLDEVGSSLVEAYGTFNQNISNIEKGMVLDLPPVDTGEAA